MIRFMLTFLFLASPVAAANPIADILCAPTKQMHDKLTRQFGENRAATGVRGPDQIMEVWTDRHGDWTLVVTYASGTSCIVAMGEHWAETTPPDPA